MASRVSRFMVRSLAWRGWWWVLGSRGDGLALGVVDVVVVVGVLLLLLTGSF